MSRRIVRSQHLSTMENVAQQIAFHSKPLCRLLDWQSFAHDQTHSGPVNGCFIPIAFMSLHDYPLIAP